MRFEDVEINLVESGDGISVKLSADSTAVSYIHLRWNRSFPDGTLFLGDAWERSYGDLQWSACNASRLMPWYFLAHCGNTTSGVGVKVRPGAMALWSVDPKGITLWLDVRCGTRGVILKNRTLVAATVVSLIYFLRFLLIILSITKND